MCVSDSVRVCMCYFPKVKITTYLLHPREYILRVDPRVVLQR